MTTEQIQILNPKIEEIKKQLEQAQNNVKDGREDSKIMASAFLTSAAEDCKKYAAYLIK